MKKGIIYVPIGGCVFSYSPTVLSCKGLGSCIALCVYNSMKKFGLLAHILLPEGDDRDRPFFFANLAVEAIINELKNRGISKDRVWAKLVGGANIFLSEEANLKIGTRNSEAIVTHLAKHGIRILNSDIGGRYGRNIEFNLEDGTIKVFTFERGEYLI